MPESPPPPRQLPFSVIGGYLGAGKTTLINRILSSGSAGRVAVMVNDFGDVNIDASLIESHDGDTISLANGCVCCSLVDGFVVALDHVRERADDLDRVLVEVSGVGDPWKVAQWGRTPGFELDAVLTLADASTIRELVDDDRVGDTVRRQVEVADIIVLTKTDLLDPGHRDEVEWWIRSVSDARVLRGGDADGVISAVLDAPQGGPLPLEGTASRASHSHASHVIASRKFDSPIERTRLTALIDSRPDGVMRVKGHVRVLGDPEQIVRIQVVGRRVETTVVKHPNADVEPVIVAVATDGVDSGDLQAWLAGGTVG